MYNKNVTGKQAGYLHPINKGNEPMNTLHLDHLGPFVKTRKRNSYLIVGVDVFTKFTFMKPVQSAKVGPVLKFLNEIFEWVGYPEESFATKVQLLLVKSLLISPKRLVLRLFKMQQPHHEPMVK